MTGSREAFRLRAVELDERGDPLDRTICPACLGQPLAGRRSCHVCDGRPVCPWCRGARYRRTVVGGMRVCPDCCDERPSRAGGLPGRERNGRREAAVIRAYREALRDGDVAEDAVLVGQEGNRA